MVVWVRIIAKGDTCWQEAGRRCLILAPMYYIPWYTKIVDTFFDWCSVKPGHSLDVRPPQMTPQC